MMLLLIDGRNGLVISVEVHYFGIKLFSNDAIVHRWILIRTIHFQGFEQFMIPSYGFENFMLPFYGFEQFMIPSYGFEHFMIHSHSFEQFTIRSHGCEQHDEV
ncbi:hypothetical protein CEXT_569281 [Caerostris extrusa]|uniref:Uncharacterized protein n=1 Tax=Caerostris extrusa TaxID=172846 RepID=A0AAV4Q664_CAEEX|nr:hypothetical protein CEXT_569281 [Caerostris extrusa]